MELPARHSVSRRRRWWSRPAGSRAILSWSSRTGRRTSRSRPRFWSVRGSMPWALGSTSHAGGASWSSPSTINGITRAAFRLSAQAVVVATGGFQSNLELVKQNWPKDIPFPPKILVGSGINALGSGLDLARGGGVLVEPLDHQWNYPRGIPSLGAGGGGRDRRVPEQS